MCYYSINKYLITSIAKSFLKKRRFITKLIHPILKTKRAITIKIIYQILNNQNCMFWYNDWIINTYCNL